jgi:hypothetical protein
MDWTGIDSGSLHPSTWHVVWCYREFSLNGCVFHDLGVYWSYVITSTVCLPYLLCLHFAITFISSICVLYFIISFFLFCVLWDRKGNWSYFDYSSCCRHFVKVIFNYIFLSPRSQFEAFWVSGGVCLLID